MLPQIKILRASFAWSIIFRTSSAFSTNRSLLLRNLPITRRDNSPGLLTNSCVRVQVGPIFAEKEIQHDDTSTGTVIEQSAKQKKRKKKNNVKWIACSSTKEVTRAINKYVKEGDKVAELGSQLRESSIALCTSIGADGHATLVDIERKFPNEKKGQKRTSAMRRQGDETEFYKDRTTFIETKEFQCWREALFFRDSERSYYDALVVDVSTVAGNDLDLTCISLVKEFIALNSRSDDDENPCRVVIIKSGSLHSLARRLHHAQRIISGTQSVNERDNEKASIVGTVGVEEYRRTIPHVVKKGDVCVEIGCHFGTSTILIDNAAKDVNSEGGCLGVDVGVGVIRSAKVKFPNVPFKVGDGFKTGEVARMKVKYFKSPPTSRIYDVVYVDIGGLSGSEGLLEAISLLSSISNCFEPRCIVIKSLCVRRLASSLIPFSEVWKKDNTKRNDEAGLKN